MAQWRVVGGCWRDVCCGLHVTANGCRVAQSVRCKVGEWQAGGDVSWCLGGASNGCGVWLSAGTEAELLNVQFR
jgi:hypothetical protein